MHSDVTASIVVFKNDPRMVLEAARSFLNSSPDSTLYLIDNSPKDKLHSYFKSDPRVQYIFNNRNLGFGAAHNIALRKSIERGAKFHVVLNPDVYFDRNVIPQLTSMMNTHPEIGLVMPKVLNPDGSVQHVCKLLPSPENLFFRRFLPFFRKLWKKNQVYDLKFSGYDKIMDVPSLSGCFMLLRNDYLREIGLFDEDIFLYTEDIDLSRRIHKHYRTVFNPEVSIYHFHERGSYKRLMPLLFHLKSTVTYFNKWGWFHDPEREHINRMALARLTH